MSGYRASKEGQKKLRQALLDCGGHAQNNEIWLQKISYALTEQDGWPKHIDTQYRHPTKGILKVEQDSGYPKGVSTQTFKRCLKGQNIQDPDIFKAICKALNLPWEEVADLFTGYEAVESIHPNNQGIPKQFQTLIEDKTKSFVGREYVFQAIADFLGNYPKGYFIIEGDPGIGKSAILAEYVQRNNCIAYFNYISSGNTSEEQFLESVCQQIISRYNLPYPSLPYNATKNGSFLWQLLSEAKVNQPNEKLVIAIDALDEVIGVTNQEDSPINILYLPSNLSEGVYFIMTRRRLKKQTLTVADNVSKSIFDLMEYQEQNLEDARLFVRQEVTKKDEEGSLEREELLEWIEKRSLTVEDFVNTLTEQSKGNFIYLVFILNSIENGFYDETNIETIPKNLRDYYDSLCQRVGMFSGLLRYTKAQIVYILSETNNPIPYEEIVEIIKYTEVQNPELIVDEVLDVWIQILRHQQLYGQDFYSPYHHTYRDFLRDNQTVKRAGVTLKGIKKLIADSMDLYGDS